MMKLLLIAAVMLSMCSNAQTQDRVVIKLKNDGWMPLTVGVLVHTAGAWTTFAAGDLSDPKIRANFIIFNSVGIGLDALAIGKFVKHKRSTHKPKF